MLTIFYLLYHLLYCKHESYWLVEKLFVEYCYFANRKTLFTEDRKNWYQINKWISTELITNILKSKDFLLINELLINFLNKWRPTRVSISIRQWFLFLPTRYSDYAFVCEVYDRSRRISKRKRKQACLLCRCQPDKQTLYCRERLEREIRWQNHHLLSR